MPCNPEYWALVVGISHYPGLSKLDGPEQDATDFFDWVTSPAGGGVCFDPAADPKTQKARLVLSSQFQPPAVTAYDAKPTKSQIENWLRRLHEIAKSRDDLKVGKRLYLYFAGHGFEVMPNAVDKNGEPVVLMANAEPDALEHVPARLWAELYFAAGYFDEFLLFVDCCREVDTNWPLSVPQVKPGIADPAHVKRLYAFATKSSKLSRERSFNGTSRGLFTYALMQVLRGSGAEGGRITAQAVKGWLFKQMPTLVGADGQVSKTPDIPYPQGEPDDFVIVAAAPPATHTIIVDVPGAVQGDTVDIVDGAGALVASRALAADATCTFHLESGNGFFFKARCGARERLFEVAKDDRLTL
jgi:Caspase domain